MGGVVWPAVTAAGGGEVAAGPDEIIGVGAGAATVGDAAIGWLGDAAMAGVDAGLAGAFVMIEGRVAGGGMTAGAAATLVRLEAAETATGAVMGVVLAGGRGPMKSGG